MRAAVLVSHTNNKIEDYKGFLKRKIESVVIKALISYAVVSKCSKSIQCYANEK